MPRFLIGSCLSEVLTVPSAGIAPSGTKGLRKPTITSPPCLPFFSACTIWTPGACDLPQENAVQTQHSASDGWQSIFRDGLLWKKQKYPFAFHWEGAHSPLPFSRGLLRATDSEASSSMSQKGGLTRISNQSTPDIDPQEWESGAKALGWGNTYPRDNSMTKTWRNCYLFGTTLYSGDRETLAGFHDANQCWLINPPKRHLSKQGRKGKPGFWTSTPPLTYHLQ